MRKHIPSQKHPRLYSCAVLTFAALACLTAPALAADDLWTIANNLIVDLYNHIAGISTVLAGLMSAVAVIGAKLSNNQWNRGVHCLHHPAVQRSGNPHALTRLQLRGGGGNA